MYGVKRKGARKGFVGAMSSTQGAKKLKGKLLCGMKGTVNSGRDPKLPTREKELRELSREGNGRQQTAAAAVLGRRHIPGPSKSKPWQLQPHGSGSRDKDTEWVLVPPRLRKAPGVEHV